MTADDYDAVYSLWLSCAGMGLNSVDDSRYGIARFLDRNPETCFVALESDELIGTILAGNDGRRGFIYHTAVRVDKRGQGIGRALVESAMCALERLGITKAALVVFGRNQDGNAFWERLGFTERQDIIYRNKEITKTQPIDT